MSCWRKRELRFIQKYIQKWHFEKNARVERHQNQIIVNLKNCGVLRHKSTKNLVMVTKITLVMTLAKLMGGLKRYLLQFSPFHDIKESLKLLVLFVLPLSACLMYQGCV